jgi:hypothetical protein
MAVTTALARHPGISKIEERLSGDDDAVAPVIIMHTLPSLKATKSVLPGPAADPTTLLLFVDAFFWHAVVVTVARRGGKRRKLKRSTGNEGYSDESVF